MAGGEQRRRTGVVLAAVTVVVVGVVAAALALGVGDDDGPLQVQAGDGTTAAADPGPRLLRAGGTVLDGRDHGPSLCLGAIATSYPPQCGTVPVTNWDWDEVDGEERAMGVVWGDYEVVGTYDGKRFTLTEPPAPVGTRRPEPPEDTLATPCAPPDGGWRPVDPARTTEADSQALREAAKRQPDFAGLWIDDPAPRDPQTAQDEAKVIWNVAFTGDLERHEAELRAVWGGLLCVSLLEHSTDELDRALDEIRADKSIDALVSYGGGGSDNAVHLEVVFDDGTLQRRFDERYGEGVVAVTSALRPVR